jgi:hypothetical protein
MDITLISLLVLNAIQFISSIWLHIRNSKCKASKCMEVEVEMTDEKKGRMRSN